MEAKDLIGHISGGRVLDVATGNGGFIPFLIEGLQDYDEIIGIDLKESIEQVFAEMFKNQPIHYRQMDAASLDFPPASFDTVCISNSLHHLPDLTGALSEMKRVLKPGGHAIIAEMYCDNQTETQMTHVDLHHWWGAIDRAQGISHNETFRREEIIEMVAGLGLGGMRVYDLSELDEDPHEPQILEHLNPIIDRYIERAAGHPELQARGAALRKRLQEVGFHGATSLLLIGQKI